MANNGTVSGTVTYTADTAGFGQAIVLTGSQYVSLPPAAFAGVTPGQPFTLSARVRTTVTSGYIVALSGHDSNGNGPWIGAGDGKAAFGLPNLNPNPCVSNVAIADGNTHHLELVTDGSTTASLYVDGVLAVTTVAGGGSVAFNPITTAAIGRLQTDFYWVGRVDEAAVFLGQRHTANFTPPATPYAGNESGLVSLYHLDGNANDSAGSMTLSAALTAGLYLSPYNWRTVGTAAQSANPGAYFKAKFSGTSLKLNLDTAAIAAAQSDISQWPVLAVKIDGASTWTAVPITGDTVTLASGLSAGTHSIQCVIKIDKEMLDRWTGPASAVKIVGLTLDPGGVVSAPTLRAKRAVVFGDSITEGVYVNAGNYDGNDATGTWAWKLAELLDAEVGIVGFGATGWTRGGSGNVPKLGTFWSSYDSSTSRLSSGLLSPAPDYVVVNEGTNDTAASDASVTGEVTSWLTAVRAAAPSTRICVVVPFNQTKVAAIKAGFAAWSDSAHNSVVADLGSGGQSTVAANSYDGLHPNAGATPALANGVYAAMAPAGGIVIDDTFNRANTSVGSGANSTTGVGNGWVDYLGTQYSIASNHLTSAAGTSASTDPPAVPLYYGSTSFKDGEVWVYRNATDGGNPAGVARFSAASGGSGYAVLWYATNQFFIYKRVAGTSTTLLSGYSIPGTMPANGVLRVAVASTDSNTTQITAEIYDRANLSTALHSKSITDTTAALQSAGYWGVSGYNAIVVDEARINQAQTGGPINAGTASSVATYKTVAKLSATAATGGIGPLSYQWHRSTVSGFTPGVGTAVSGATGITLRDAGLTAGATYYYKLAITDGGNQSATTNQVTVTTLPANAKVIGFVGNSVTAGVGASGTAQQAWSMCLAAINAAGTPVAGVTCGVSGSTTGDWLSGGANFAAFKSASDDVGGFDSVLYSLGVNDAKTATLVSGSTYRSNVAAFVASAQSQITTLQRVILNQPTYVVPGSINGQWDASSNTAIQGYSGRLDELVNGSTVRVGDRTAYAHFAATPGQLGDGVHPNDAGHAWLGNAWSTATLAALTPPDTTAPATPKGPKVIFGTGDVPGPMKRKFSFTTDE